MDPLSPLPQAHREEHSDDGSELDGLSLAMSTVRIGRRGRRHTDMQCTPQSAVRPRKRAVSKTNALMRDEEGDKENDAPQLRDLCDNDVSKDQTPPKVTPSRLNCIGELRDELTCSICLDVCKWPCMTPCGHNFCHDCLKTAKTHSNKCAKCRAPLPAKFQLSVNYAMWNTIKLLFPSEAATASAAPPPPPPSSDQTLLSLGPNPFRMRQEIQARNRAQQQRAAAMAPPPRLITNNSSSVNSSSSGGSRQLAELLNAVQGSAEQQLQPGFITARGSLASAAVPQAPQARPHSNSGPLSERLPQTQTQTQQQQSQPTHLHQLLRASSSQSNGDQQLQGNSSRAGQQSNSDAVPHSFNPFIRFMSQPAAASHARRVHTLDESPPHTSHTNFASRHSSTHDQSAGDPVRVGGIHAAAQPTQGRLFLGADVSSMQSEGAAGMSMAARQHRRAVRHGDEEESRSEVRGEAAQPLGSSGNPIVLLSSDDDGGDEQEGHAAAVTGQDETGIDRQQQAQVQRSCQQPELRGQLQRSLYYGAIQSNRVVPGMRRPSASSASRPFSRSNAVVAQQRPADTDTSP